MPRHSHRTASSGGLAQEVCRGDDLHTIPDSNTESTEDTEKRELPLCDLCGLCVSNFAHTALWTVGADSLGKALSAPDSPVPGTGGAWKP